MTYRELYQRLGEVIDRCDKSQWEARRAVPDKQVQVSIRRNGPRKKDHRLPIHYFSSVVYGDPVDKGERLDGLIALECEIERVK